MLSVIDVAAQATNTLKNTHPALRHLRVESAEDALVILGTVHCYYHKQLAQEALKPLRGDLHLLNQVKVVVH